jgi:hypothetical protein
MKKRQLPWLAGAVLSLACASLFAQTPAKHFPKPDRIRYDGYCFRLVVPSR